MIDSAFDTVKAVSLPDFDLSISPPKSPPPTRKPFRRLLPRRAVSRRSMMCPISIMQKWGCCAVLRCSVQGQLLLIRGRSQAPEAARKRVWLAIGTGAGGGHVPRRWFPPQMVDQFSLASGAAWPCRRMPSLPCISTTILSAPRVTGLIACDATSSAQRNRPWHRIAYADTNYCAQAVEIEARDKARLCPA